MTFPGQLPSRVFFAVGDHVSHKRRRRRRTAEAEWLTDKWQNESRVSLSLSIPPHLSWGSQSQDQGSGYIGRYLPFTNPNVENLSNQCDIFQWWLSARLDGCFGHTIIPRVSVFEQRPWVSRQRWRGYRLAVVECCFRSGRFGFIEAEVHCEYISLATSYSFLMAEFCVPYHLLVCLPPAVSVNSAGFIWRHLVIWLSLQLTWQEQVMANCLQD